MDDREIIRASRAFEHDDILGLCDIAERALDRAERLARVARAHDALMNGRDRALGYRILDEARAALQPGNLGETDG